MKTQGIIQQTIRPELAVSYQWEPDDAPIDPVFYADTGAKPGDVEAWCFTLTAERIENGEKSVLSDGIGHVLFEAGETPYLAGVEGYLADMLVAVGFTREQATEIQARELEGLKS